MRHTNQPLVAESVPPVGPRLGIVERRLTFKLQFFKILL
jgi:hypothetical protein